MKKENPSSKRSKEYLTQALLKLMREKPFQKITIKEITEEAQLARMTFYSNFENKEEILKYHSDCLLLKFIENFKRGNGKTERDMFCEFFKFWKEEREFVNVLKKNRVFILIELFEKYIYQLNDMFSFFDFEGECPETVGFKVAYCVGGLCNVLNRWIDRDMKDDYEELVDMILKDFKKNKN